MRNTTDAGPAASGPARTAVAAAAAVSPVSSGRHWARIAAAYAVPDARRSLLQLLSTVLPLAAFLIAMALLVDDAYWATLLLSVPAAAFVVRLFMIQHDCGHRAFFRSPRLNDLLGHAIGVLTLTPHAYWRQSHNLHHSTSGNLDRRGMGDIDVLTVREYLALSRWRRLTYRAYRHPLVLLGIGPLYLFVIKYRLPLDGLLRRRDALASVLATNLALAGLIVGFGLWLGFAEILMVQVPVILLSSLAGVWLFYVQHQFERTYWRRQDDWDFHDAAIHGSSHYHLPQPLRWFTADIGLHHIHHLSSRIPNYRLGECLAANPELREIGRMTWRDSLRCLRLALWDEEKGRLVRFGEAQGKPTAS